MKASTDDSEDAELQDISNTFGQASRNNRRVLEWLFRSLKMINRIMKSMNLESVRKRRQINILRKLKIIQESI